MQLVTLFTLFNLWMAPDLAAGNNQNGSILGDGCNCHPRDVSAALFVAYLKSQCKQ